MMNLSKNNGNARTEEEFERWMEYDNLVVQSIFRNMTKESEKAFWDEIESYENEDGTNDVDMVEVLRKHARHA